MTTLTARTRETIRAALLARLSARFAAGLAPLDVREPGDAWQSTDALAVLLSALEVQAAGAPSQILPDRATGSWLDAHGDAAALPRQTGESDADYQTRVLAWWSYRLGTGAPSDLVAVCESVDDVEEAYVYPNEGLASALAPGTRGASLALLMGVAQGASATNTRILTSTQIGHVRDYIEGTEDAHGVFVDAGEQRRIVCGKIGTSLITPTGNTALVVPTLDPRAVTLAVENAPTHPFPFSGSYALTAGDAVSFTVAGDHRDLVGSDFLLYLGTDYARGGYTRVHTTAVVFIAGETTFTLGAVLDNNPTGTAYPCPPNWEVILQALVDVFDALTPGDSSPALRYPAPTAARPARLSLGALYRAVRFADGVRRCTIAAPAASVTPAAFGLITLGVVTLTEI